jgi:hypothetical protein
MTSRSSSLWRRSAAALALVTATLSARAASAQQYLLGASAQIASGIDGGGGSRSSLMRSRTRLRLGGDARIDESPKDILGAAILVEVERHATLGVDARYMRQVGRRFIVNAGAIGYLVPATLIGPSVGFDLQVPLGSSAAVTVGPEFNVFVLGTDLPDGTVIWQGLLQIGIHVDL